MYRYAFTSVCLQAAIFGFAIITLGCKAVVASQLSEDQANQIMVALDNSSITATKVPEGKTKGKPHFRIEVASGETGRALSILQSAELPKQEAPGWNEIFADVGVIPTETEEKARLIAALSGELSRSIEAMPGIVHARVHIALLNNPKGLLDAPTKQPKSSVVVKYHPSSQPIDTSSIKKLIAGAVQDLKPENITVIGIKLDPIPKQLPKLVQIGPVSVTRESAPVAKLVTSILLCMLVVLTIVILLLIGWIRRSPTGK